MPDIADTSDSSVVVVTSGGPESNLPNKRTLAATSNKITLTDGGAGGTVGVDVAEANLTLQNQGGILTVPKGGSGVGTLTGILKGNGTSNFSAVTAPTGAIVGDTDTQTLTDKTLDIIDGDNDILYSYITNTKRRFGYIEASGESTQTAGPLAAPTITSTSAVTGIIDANGVASQVNTGTTSNTYCGFRSSLVARTRRDFNFRFIMRFSIATVTNTRFYGGLKSALTAFPATDTPLASGDSGVIFGYRSTDSNGLQVFHNDGSAGVTAVSTGVTIGAGTIYDLEIKSIEASTKFQWRTRSNYGSWSAYTDITTNMPAATTVLGYDMGISNTSGVNRTFDLRFAEYWGDK